MMLLKKIKAGALQFVLFIGTIIAILLLTFLLISHTHNFFDKKTDILIAIIQETDFGLEYAFQKKLSDGNKIQITSNFNKDISITVQKEYWGIFEKYTSTTSHKSMSYSKTALVGNSYPNEIPALYLRDRQKPLVLAGTSKITGDAYLPAHGIRLGNINGNPYQHNKLLYGKELRSDSAIPELDSEMLNETVRLTQTYNGTSEQISLKRNMDIAVSFDTPTKLITGRNVSLEELKLTGNIIVVGTEQIFVHSTAILKDVILVAPEIIISDGVRGSFQAIANSTIQVGKSCELFYPSAVIVNDMTKVNSTNYSDVEKPKIAIGNNSVINGVVAYINQSDEQTYIPQIKISENSLVHGEVYCTGNLEHLGKVHGTVVTDGFISFQNGNIYQNHLYNGTIDFKGLKKKYAGLSILDNEQHKKVMKWLY